ncbi:MAG: DUF4846 domain-containing protein [Planctomycetota bacterium]|nr:DUF4846 domain-containing protein [Planctomycetota bacterium]
MVACYAGTASLERELKQVGRPTEARIGDVFIQGGYPGHAVIIVDVARHDRPGRKIMLLAQSFMPAQEMHVLKNPRSPALDPWFEAEFDKTLTTPHWVFQTEHLRRF